VKKQILLIILLVATSLYSQAQTAVSPSTFVVRFTDKNNAPYNVNAPLDFLSQRAISRRTNQSIAISPQDFPVNANYVNQVVSLGAQVLNRSKWLNAIAVFCTDSLVVQNIAALPFVQSVEAVKKQTPSTGIPKFEPENRFTQVYQNKNLGSEVNSRALFDYGPSLGQVAMLGGDLMHMAGYTGNGKVIAVIDAGFLIADQCETFDSLFANNQILGTWDFVAGNNNVYDDHYHGTYVLSTIAGNSPGELIGTAPKASFWLLRSEDAPSEFIVEEFNWVCAAEFADSVGADIINSSLGYTTFDNPAQNHTFADLNGTTAMASIGAEIAASKGIIVCNSAGNSGNDPWLHIAVPADANNILAVAAVDSNENIANFSSRGHSADGRIKPDVAAQGVATVGQYQPGVFVVGNGTSFASPLIAGMCASFWEALPNLTAMQVIQKVKESCDQFNNPDSLKGYGIPDFAQAYQTVTGKQLALPIQNKVDFLAPNPFKDFIKMRYYAADTHFIEVRIFDMMGKELIYKKHWCETRSYNTLDLQIPSGLSQGMYFIQLVTKHEKQTFKIIKE
jgi:subtilisin family serine protease